MNCDNGTHHSKDYFPTAVVSLVVNLSSALSSGSSSSSSSEELTSISGSHADAFRFDKWFKKSIYSSWSHSANSSENKTYRDFLFAVGTNTLGYSNKRINDSVIKAIKNGTMTSLNCKKNTF